MTLWGGRFSGKLDPAAWALNASLPFDKRLAKQDVDGSIAWAAAIAELVERPQLVEAWRRELALPLRIEEESFFYESLYRRLLRPA